MAVVVFIAQKDLFSFLYQPTGLKGDIAVNKKSKEWGGIEFDLKLHLCEIGVSGRYQRETFLFLCFLESVGEISIRSGTGAWIRPDKR